MSTELVEISYEHIRRRSDDAVLLSIDDEDVWLPLSEIRDWDADLKTLHIPEWLAIDRGLE